MNTKVFLNKKYVGCFIISEKMRMINMDFFCECVLENLFEFKIHSKRTSLHDEFSRGVFRSMAEIIALFIFAAL